MKNQKQQWRKMVSRGTCKCKYEPRCEGGLEGYDLGETYRYEEMRDDKGRYFRVYPNPDTGYKETCRPILFNKCFDVVTKEDTSAITTDQDFGRTQTLPESGSAAEAGMGGVSDDAAEN